MIRGTLLATNGLTARDEIFHDGALELVIFAQSHRFKLLLGGLSETSNHQIMEHLTSFVALGLNRARERR